MKNAETGPRSSRCVLEEVGDVRGVVDGESNADQDVDGRDGRNRHVPVVQEADGVENLNTQGLCMVLCRWRTSRVWLGSIRPRSQCVGGMLLVQLVL